MQPACQDLNRPFRRRNQRAVLEVVQSTRPHRAESGGSSRIHRNTVPETAFERLWHSLVRSPRTSQVAAAIDVIPANKDLSVHADCLAGSAKVCSLPLRMRGRQQNRGYDLILTVFALASSVFGRVTVRTPSLYAASTLLVSTSPGNTMSLRKLPKRRSQWLLPPPPHAPSNLANPTNLSNPSRPPIRVHEHALSRACSPATCHAESRNACYINLLQLHAPRPRRHALRECKLL